jgi:SnoaL-like domain
VPRYQSQARVQGRHALRDWFLDYDTTIRSKHRHRRKITSPWIQVQGNEATWVCYIDADSLKKSTGEVFIHAPRYEGRLLKDEGGWWIMEWVVNAVERSYIYAAGPQIDRQTWASEEPGGKA